MLVEYFDVAVLFRSINPVNREQYITIWADMVTLAVVHKVEKCEVCRLDKQVRRQNVHTVQIRKLGPQL